MAHKCPRLPVPVIPGPDFVRIRKICVPSYVINVSREPLILTLIIMVQAIVNDVVVAESSETRFVEGNHYFPPESIKVVLTLSDTT